MGDSQPRRRWAVLGLLFGAPVSAEYLQAYLTSTGDALELLVGLLILAPLYGGAALVIREVAVRTGRGWPGILLLAAAFGVIMPGLVDLSLFTEQEPDVTGWDELWSPTSVPVLGISVHSGLAWALGHVVMSIGVPIALLDALAPKLRGRSLLGRKGLVVVVILWLASGALIHSDSRAPGSTPHPAQVAGVLAVAIGLVLLARTRLGRPVRRRVERRAWGTIPTVGLGLATMLAVDLPPPTWIGLVLLVVLVLGIGVVVALAARSAAWGLPQVTGLASGALVERALVGSAGTRRRDDREAGPERRPSQPGRGRGDPRDPCRTAGARGGHLTRPACRSTLHSWTRPSVRAGCFRTPSPHRAGHSAMGSSSPSPRTRPWSR